MGEGLIYQSFIAGRYLNQEEESGVGSRHRKGVSTGRPLKQSHPVGTPSDISMSATADRSVTVSVISECVKVPWLLSTFAMIRASSSW